MFSRAELIVNINKCSEKHKIHILDEPGRYYFKTHMAMGIKTLMT